VKDFRRTEDVLRAALSGRTFSAVSAEIGRASGPVWTFAAGQLGVDDLTPVGHETVFDLASLTKVLSTTAIALLLTTQGTLDLHSQVASVIPDWSRPDRVGVQVRDLLEHTSGLPAYRDYFTRIAGRDAYVAAIAAEPLEYPPRTRAIYSDLGFITLGEVLERIGGSPLNRQFDAWKAVAGINEPLTYLPPHAWRARTAITEYDRWRSRLLQGEVHDENAAALGGVAAHAGLFGTAAAVGDAARWWMRQLDTEPARLFVQRSTVPGSSRALGWDTMLPTSSCGTLMSTSAFGHTGFTGTTLWIDPSRDVYFTLLTNRVHLSRANNDAIRQVRRSFHDTANQDLA
jgi:CubicO group peptidase (beta-lactamase class C family)